MERFIKEDDRECMKMVILKHEETFRQQVYELHRLYRVQKLLMGDMKNNQLNKDRSYRRAHANFVSNEDQGNVSDSCLTRSSLLNQKPRRALNLDLSADEFIERVEEDGNLEIEQDINIELTLTTSRNNWRKKVDTSFTCDSGVSYSSPSITSLKLSANEWGIQHVKNADVNDHNGNKSGLEFEQGLREDELRQPTWLLECLSLKMV